MLGVSWRLPSGEQRRAARGAFSEMVRSFEAAIGLRPTSDPAPQAATPVAPAAQEPSSEGAAASPTQAEFLDVMHAWREIVQNNAPQDVRSNAWLIVSWAVWCFRYEEPRLYWAAAIACLLVGSAWVYDAARAVAERVAA
jgi:hypothetical protein